MQTNRPANERSEAKLLFELMMYDNEPTLSARW